MPSSKRSVTLALLTSLLGGIGFPASALALEVHVATPNGAPRIIVDGRPVRARMFFGGPGSMPLHVGPEWQPVDFEFTAQGSAENGTMHFRFGPTAGDVFLDDVQVTDLGEQHDLVPLCDFEKGQTDFDRDWTCWPPAAKSGEVIRVEAKAGHADSGGLHVKLTNADLAQWPDFHIYHQTNLHIAASHHYRVHLWAKAVPARSLNVDFYRPGQPFIHLGGPPDPFITEIKLAADAGVNFVSFPIGLPWPKPGEPVNWEGVDAACQTVIDANPLALLIPRVPMNPPDWWRQSHPDDVMQWEDGHRAMMVPASPQYRHDAAERLAAFVAHLEEKFGDHVAGYHPSGQNTGEWFYEDSWKRPLNGYAPADLAGWRLWLRKTYATDEALRQAWNKPAASFDTAAVPTPAARHGAPAGIFRDPATEQAIVDWGRYQQEAMADCVSELAHAARQASKGKKLVLFFYGYEHELSVVANGPATSGHFALRRVLDSPDIDMLCSPISYFDRGLGGSAPSMSAAESAALAGKMWLNEDDTHTYLATGEPPGWRDHVTTLQATNEELTRNVAEEALRNFATWWMDLTFTGWFKDAGMWERMAHLKVLDEPLLKTPTPFHPEVAAVVDEAAMMHVAAGGQGVTGPCAHDSRAQLARAGAPYGQYLLDDVLAGKVHAKLYVFLNAWSLSAGDRDKLLQATRGSVCVWCYAPGYFEGDKISPHAMKQLTGFDLQPLSKIKGWATPTAVGRKAGMKRSFGVQQAPVPLFAALNVSADHVLATYPNGSAAIAVKKSEDGKGASLFVGAPGLTSELLRFAAHLASVHLFTETDCNIYANGPFLALHASKDGPVTLDTGDSSPVTDMLSGAILGNGPHLTLPLHFGETRVLKIKP